MGRYLARRLLQLVPTLLLVSVVVFVSLRVIPGDPAQILAGETATPADVEALRRRWGLDRPIHVQYLVYLEHLLRGDFGNSTRTFAPVAWELWPRFLATLELAPVAIAVAVVLGVTAGVAGALRPHTWIDYTSTTLALVGLSAPIFWTGLLLLLLFSVMLNWLPSGGRGTPVHLVLPGLALGAFAAGVIARQTRAALLEVLGLVYVTTARAKGLAERRVIAAHALRNALLPVVTVIGLQFGSMLGGSVLTETVFSWPGMGKYLVDSLGSRDYPAVQASILVFAVAFAIVNLVVDLLYAFLDPRIRYA